MFAKVVLDEKIIDVFEDLAMHCCKYNNRSGMVLRCGEDESPSGIISERTGEIYHVDGWPTFLGGYEPAGVVKIDWIEEAEYKELLLAIDETGTVPDPDDEVTETPDDAPKILSRQALTAEVTRLAEQNAALMEQNEMLLGCLLEMSEAVYA